MGLSGFFKSALPHPGPVSTAARSSAARRSPPPTLLGAKEVQRLGMHSGMRGIQRNFKVKLRLRLQRRRIRTLTITHGPWQQADVGLVINVMQWAENIYSKFEPKI